MKATKMIQNQKGFTLIELMVVAVILAIISAIAVPIYNGYKKDAMTQEAYQTLAQVADLCIGKATKAKEMGITTIPTGAVSMPDNGTYFKVEQTTACTTTAAAVYTASAKATNATLGTDTLIVTVNPNVTPATKVYSGNLF